MVKENKILLGQCIFVCKEAIVKETFMKLRKSAVEALMSLSHLHDNADFHDVVLREQLSQILFIVLPQVATVLIKVCQEDTLRGPHLIQVSLKTLGRFLCLILEDYERKSSNEPVTNQDFLRLLNRKPNEVQVMPKVKLEVTKIEKSIEWMSSTTQSLSCLIPNLKSLRSSQYRDIRYEFAVLSFNLLSKCLVNVHPFSRFLLENLIASCDDSDEKVRKFSKKSLAKLHENISNLNQEITELFNAHLIVMPRILMTGMENEQISGLTLLNSYLTINPSILENISVLEKFINILLSCCEIDTDNDLVLFQTTNVELTDDSYQLKMPWKKFKKFKIEAARVRFSKICQNIAQSTISHVCLNYILDRINSLEHLVLIIEILSCEKQLENEQVSAVIEEFLNENYWKMTIEIKEVKKVKENVREEWWKESTPGLYESAIEVKLKDVKLDEDDEDEGIELNLKTIRYNILCTCFVTELIGCGSLQLRSKFQPFILRSMHKILEKAGSSNFLIRNAGLYSIKCITKAMGHEEVHQLISEHSDFLLFNIQNQLKRNHDNEAFLDMISVIFKFAKTSIASYVEDIIETASNHLSNEKSKGNSCAYLKLFNLYAISVKNNDDFDDEEVEMETEKILNDLKEPENILNDFQQAMKNVEPEVVAEDTKIDEETHEEKEEEKKAPLPHFIQLILKILNSSLPFFASSNPAEVILVHEIFKNSLKTLNKFDDINFLPTIHQMWYPFTKQFQGSNFIILQHSFRLLTIITSLAKDFVYHKSTACVIPTINKFLIASLSHKNVTYSQEFKLQKEILSGYGQLLIDLGIKDKMLDDIINILLKYKNHQNEQLAGATRRSFDALSVHDPMLMKFKLLNF